MNPRSIAFVGASNNLFKMGTIQFSQMVRGDREFMAGMSRLLGFPPSIMFGLGGVFAEALKDRAIRLAPLDRDDVFSMRESLNGAALLGPYRSMAPVDMGALADILAALGEPALHSPVIRETDLNPIVIVDGRPIVADAVMAM
jgi:acetyltransferase